MHQLNSRKFCAQFVSAASAKQMAEATEADLAAFAQGEAGFMEISHVRVS